MLLYQKSPVHCIGKLGFKEGTQTDIAIYRLNRPRGCFSKKERGTFKYFPDILLYSKVVEMLYKTLGVSKIIHALWINFQNKGILGREAFWVCDFPENTSSFHIAVILGQGRGELVFAVCKRNNLTIFGLKPGWILTILLPSREPWNIHWPISHFPPLPIYSISR